MADMRSCIKTGCRWPASATLSYRYATAEVWLSDLADEHPSTHDLCPHHADAMRVPRGWTLVDDRQPAEAVHEPSAAEIVERVATLRGTVDRMLERDDAPEEGRPSRYSRLLEDLPTHEPSDGAPGEDTSGDHADAPHTLVGVGLSHEVAPVAAEMATVRSVMDHRHGRGTGAVPAETTGGDEPLDEIDLADDARVGVDAEDRTDDHDGPGDGDAERDDPAAGPQVRGAVVVPLPLRMPDESDGGAT